MGSMSFDGASRGDVMAFGAVWGRFPCVWGSSREFALVSARVFAHHHQPFATGRNGVAYVPPCKFFKKGFLGWPAEP